MAALAAVTAAVAVAVPAADASAATTQPTASTRIVTPVPYTPPAYFCLSLARQAQTAALLGNHILANLLGQTLMYVGCGGAAI
jgi:hypothetical protein